MRSVKRLLMSRSWPMAIGGTHMQEAIISPSRASASKSLNLLLQSGMLAPSTTGAYHLLPPLVRSVEKLSNLIDDKMRDHDCQKVFLASLGSKTMWMRSGRWNSFGEELVKTKIGGMEHCLCPTHEEAICGILQHFGKQLSHQHCPLRVYQTTTKFRNELSPQHGLLRCREFLMNDLYTVDTDRESAMKTYKEIGEMYDDLFEVLKIDIKKVKALTGNIGGDLSHEYHILADIGEDHLLLNNETGECFNSEYLESVPNLQNFTKVNAIEVGHTFYLGQHYSKKFDLLLSLKHGEKAMCEMGCYGLGVTRIIAACIEKLSLDNGLRWPMQICPYKVCIILPKGGSKESVEGNALGEHLYDTLQTIPQFKGDVIMDDRPKRTLGWKVRHAHLIGHPVVLVIGPRALSNNPQIEVIFQPAGESTTQYVHVDNVVDTVKSILM